MYKNVVSVKYPFYPVPLNSIYMYKTVINLLLAFILQLNNKHKQDS